MTMAKKLTAAALTLLLVLPVLPGAARAEWSRTELRRYNVVLVVDKSGSLVCANESGSDPDGLRYDALRLFLGLLTEGGNNVGAVVFDDFVRYEAGVKPLEGMEAKKAFIHTIEGYYPRDDTDIGRAMLRATELLRDMSEENDLPCMILLFSDGMTDFETGDIQAKRQESYARAQQALNAAQEEGIVISGILLNVDGAAERGRGEFQVYTRGTGGEFEEVTKPEDLATAFRRLYHIINGTVYTGAQRVAFSESGEAEIYFTVPSFGVEEVNIIVEGEALRRDRGGESVDMEILHPSGQGFEIAGHELDSARYRLVKLPDPDLGIWRVRLRGTPEDWVDVTMVCNASLEVALWDENPEDVFKTLRPYSFSATVEDPGVERLSEEQLGELKAVLVREELATGAVREYEMRLEDGGFVPVEAVSFPKNGGYRLSAVVSLGDFKVRSEPLDFIVELTPLAPVVESITDMLEWGRFRDGLWELELSELFDVDEGSEVQYTLSDDHEGLLSIEDNVLRARLRDARPFSFTVTAEDQMGQRAEIAFELEVPKVTAVNGYVSDITALGSYQNDIWEAELSELFTDPKGGEPEYELSSDCGGAVVMEDGVLRANLKDSALSFTLTATDFTGQSAATVFDLSVPTVTAKFDQVTNIMRLGRLSDFEWELPLEGLFVSSEGLPLSYTLSDDCGGAVRIEDGVLRVDFHELREAAFELSAANPLGREAVIPFTLKVPGPAASVGGIEETVKTGLFQEDVWERRLDGLFGDPKGGRLSYALSDDFGGAAEIAGGMVRVNMKGLKKADFTLRATDEYGLSAEIPVALRERNMTVVYLLCALAALMVIGVPTGIFLRRRRR